MESGLQQQDSLAQLLVIVSPHLLLDGHQHQGQISHLLPETQNHLSVCLVLFQHWQQREQLAHFVFQFLKVSLRRDKVQRED